MLTNHWRRSKSFSTYHTSIERMFARAFLAHYWMSKENQRMGYSRRDLQDVAIRLDLYLVEKVDKFYLYTVPHTLSRNVKQVLYSRLWDLKWPNGYSSNIRICISMEDYRRLGLKSHDCHVLMQQETQYKDYVHFFMNYAHGLSTKIEWINLMLTLLRLYVYISNVFFIVFL